MEEKSKEKEPRRRKEFDFLKDLAPPAKEADEMKGGAGSSKPPPRGSSEKQDR